MFEYFGRAVKGLVLSSSILAALLLLISICDFSVLSNISTTQSALVSAATKHIVFIASAINMNSSILFNNIPPLHTTTTTTTTHTLQPPSRSPLLPLSSPEDQTNQNSSSAASTPDVQLRTDQNSLRQPPKVKVEENKNHNNSTNSSSTVQIQNASLADPLPEPKSRNSTGSSNSSSSSSSETNHFDQKIREFIHSNNNNNSSIRNRNRNMDNDSSSWACKDGHFFMTRLLPAPLFKNRDLIAVETLFKAHPDGCLVILSDIMNSSTGQQILQPLTDLGFRILSIPPDFAFLTNNTPVSHWYDQLKKGNVSTGSIPISQNLSNLLRLLAVYRYGGSYLDTDFIVLRNFSGLSNTLGAEDVDPKTGRWKLLNNAAFVFDEGHPLLFKFLEDFAANFNGSKWGNQGPFLFTRVIDKIKADNGGVLGLDGRNFSVLPPVAFYPVHWQKAADLFSVSRPKSSSSNKTADAEKLEQQLQRLNKNSYGVHFWNAVSKKLHIVEGCLMWRLYTDHCVICRDIKD